MRYGRIKIINYEMSSLRARVCDTWLAYRVPMVNLPIHSIASCFCRVLLRSGCHTSMVRYNAGVLPTYHTSFSNDSSMTPIW